MKMNMKMRALTLVATVGLLGGTAFVAAGSTGAYFSDTVAGAGITGTLGSILVTTPTTGITFSNLLPGTSQTVTDSYKNTGNSPEDVYLNFNNLTALSALNNLGAYGSVVVTNNVNATTTTAFASVNLDDNSTRCGAFDTNPVDPSGTLCNPLPTDLLIASNVAPNVSGSFTFQFEYASALGNTTNTTWNSYPLPGYNSNDATWTACMIVSGNTAADCSNNQSVVNSSDSSGSGLPYQVIATQVGIAPNATGSKF